MTEETPRKTPLWMRVTLFTSLAFNLLIVGAAVGFIVSGGGDRREGPDVRDPASLYTRALDPEDRRLARREFVEALKQRRQDRGTIVAGLQSTLEALRAEPFDEAAFAEAIARQNARRSDRDQIGQAILVARISAMSPEARQAYADRIEEGVKRLARRLPR